MATVMKLSRTKAIIKNLQWGKNVQGKRLEKIPEQSKEWWLCPRAEGAPCWAAPHEGSPNPALFCVEHCSRCMPLLPALLPRLAVWLWHSPLQGQGELLQNTRSRKEKGMPGEGHGQGSAIRGEPGLATALGPAENKFTTSLIDYGNYFVFKTAIYCI